MLCQTCRKHPAVFFYRSPSGQQFILCRTCAIRARDKGILDPDEILGAPLERFSFPYEQSNPPKTAPSRSHYRHTATMQYTREQEQDRKEGLH